MWPYLEFAGIRFPAQALTLAAGILIGLFVLFWATRRRRVSLAFLSDHFLLLVITTFITARLTEIWLHRMSLSAFPFFWESQSGFDFFGGAIGFLVALFIVARRAGENFFIWLDLTAIATTTTLIFYHIGTFLDGTNYGASTKLPWGVSSVLTTLPVHPSQIYATVLTFILIICAAFMFKRTRTAGKTGFFLIFTVSLGYFLLDFLRGDSAPTIGVLRASQIFSIGFAVLSAGFFFKLKRKKLNARKEVKL
jgi:phosphatidylglycerol---prolipoprotein diacylglyceryl transferase